MSCRQKGFVYVVDDDDGVRESTIALLKSAGVEARGAASARHLLENFDSTAACILLDLHMPDISGFRALEILRGRCHQIPVVLFSGRSDLTSQSIASRSSARALLTKPFDHNTLIELVQQILAEAR